MAMLLHHVLKMSCFFVFIKRLQLVTLLWLLPICFRPHWKYKRITLNELICPHQWCSVSLVKPQLCLTFDLHCFLLGCLHNYITKVECLPMMILSWSTLQLQMCPVQAGETLCSCIQFTLPHAFWVMKSQFPVSTVCALCCAVMLLIWVSVTQRQNLYVVLPTFPPHVSSVL